MPRVLVDATAVPADLGGVGRYVDALLPALVRAGADLAVVCQANAQERYAALAPAARVVAAPGWIREPARRLTWEQVGLPRVARTVAADVLHCPHYTMPRWTGVRARVPVVVTLHDATFFTHPALHSPVKARFFRAQTRTALRLAARCVVPSQATLDELVRVAGASPDRVDVAHHGVDPAVFHPPRPEFCHIPEGPPGVCDTSQGPYVAFLGTLEPRKNVPALVRGWVLACEGRSAPPALVLAGGKGWDSGVDAAVDAVPPHLSVTRPGYLPVDELAGYLGGAVVVAYPSLGEGFGLPVLEAMACGATVLTTRELSLPEVGGDAVAYCGTTDAEIAAGLAGLLDDAERRAALAAAAVERAALFTWDACAAAHLQSYERAVA